MKSLVRIFSDFLPALKGVVFRPLTVIPEMYVINLLYLCHTSNNSMEQVPITFKVDKPTLQGFDALWKNEGWESRQEAIVFLIKQALARGYISREKSEISKSIGGAKV